MIESAQAAAALVGSAASGSAASGSAGVSVDLTSSSSALPSKRDDMLAKLQQSEVDRQAALDLKRQQRIQSAAFNSTSNTGIQQQVDAVLASAAGSAAVTRALIAALPSLSDPAALAAITDGIAALQSSLNNAAHYLSPHDISTCQTLIAGLEEALAARKEQLHPRKKFGFKSRQSDTNGAQPTAPVVLATSAPLAPISAPAAVVGVAAVPTGFHHLSGRDLMLSSKSLHRDIHLTHLSHCTVTLVGPTSSLHLSHLEHCRVIAGSTSGSALITACADTTFILSPHQLRLHSSHRCHLSLFCLSYPIIEHSDDIVVDPHYSVSYDGCEQDRESAGMTPGKPNAAAERVLDFRWLKQQQSPNWRWATWDERQSDIAIRVDDVRDDSALGVGFSAQ